jgi:hypothetical protein
MARLRELDKLTFSCQSIRADERQSEQSGEKLTYGSDDAVSIIIVLKTA